MKGVLVGPIVIFDSILSVSKFLENTRVCDDVLALFQKAPPKPHATPAKDLLKRPSFN